MTGTLALPPARPPLPPLRPPLPPLRPPRKLRTLDTIADLARAMRRAADELGLPNSFAAKDLRRFGGPMPAAVARLATWRMSELEAAIAAEGLRLLAADDNAFSVTRKEA